MSVATKLGQPGTCPCAGGPGSYADCTEPLTFAATDLPVEWGTGKVLHGIGPGSILERSPDGRHYFTATTVAECAAGHRVAGGHRARRFHL